MAAISLVGSKGFSLHAKMSVNTGERIRLLIFRIYRRNIDSCVIYLSHRMK